MNNVMAETDSASLFALLDCIVKQNRGLKVSMKCQKKSPMPYMAQGSIISSAIWA